MRYLALFVFVLIFQSGFGQQKNELPFIRHLINKGYYKEAIFLIDRDTINIGREQQDSLNYFRGWAHYSLKNLRQSTQSLLRVDRKSVV